MAVDDGAAVEIRPGADRRDTISSDRQQAVAARVKECVCVAAECIRHYPIAGLDERHLLSVLERHAYELYRIIRRQQERRERLAFR